MNPEHAGICRRPQCNASYGVGAHGSRDSELDLTSSSMTVTTGFPKLPANRCDVGACFGFRRQLACRRSALE
jgi:hypothetical protein